MAIEVKRAEGPVRQVFVHERRPIGGRYRRIEFERLLPDSDYVNVWCWSETPEAANTDERLPFSMLVTVADLLALADIIPALIGTA